MAEGQPVPLEQPFKLDVSRCRSCGEPHFQLACSPYKKPNAPYTHFYMCPVNVEPVNLALMQSDNVRTELHSRVMADVFAYQGKPVIFATVALEGDGQHVTAMVHRENGFPFDRYPKAMEQIWAAMKKQLPLDETRVPLDVASPQSIEIFKRIAPASELPVAEASTDVAADDSDPESDEETKR